MKQDNFNNGQYFEELAASYLQHRGLRLLARNYRKKFGEIDLIMRDKEQLVFVEVKYRRREDYGMALEQIGWRKQQRIIKAANHYLMVHRLSVPCRFDVLAISGSKSLRYNWIPNAFQA